MKSRKAGNVQALHEGELRRGDEKGHRPDHQGREAEDGARERASREAPPWLPERGGQPAHLVGKIAVEGRRERYLDRAETRKLWETLDGEPPTTAAVFRMAFLTAQRVGSVMSMALGGRGQH